VIEIETKKNGDLEMTCGPYVSLTWRTGGRELQGHFGQYKNTVGSAPADGTNNV
jgi:hypothetical protein